MSECERKRNTRGKLEFQRHLNMQGFMRSTYILHDIRYLLTTTPNEVIYLINHIITLTYLDVFC